MADLTHLDQISYRMDNARRNKIHGVPTSNEKVDTSEFADKVRLFFLTSGSVVVSLTLGYRPPISDTSRKRSAFGKCSRYHE